MEKAPWAEHCPLPAVCSWGLRAWGWGGHGVWPEGHSLLGGAGGRCSWGLCWPCAGPEFRVEQKAWRGRAQDTRQQALQAEQRAQAVRRPGEPWSTRCVPSGRSKGSALSGVHWGPSLQTGCPEPTGLKGGFPQWGLQRPIGPPPPRLSDEGAAGCAPWEEQTIEDKPTVLVPSVHVGRESGAGGGVLRARETLQTLQGGRRDLPWPWTVGTSSRSPPP